MALILDNTNKIIRDENNNIWAVKNNYSAIVDPTVNDDITQGYKIGSKWVNNNSNEEYCCTDNATGAAVWENSTVDTFIELTDVPASYSGYSGFSVKVKPDESGLEFVRENEEVTFTQVSPSFNIGEAVYRTTGGTWAKAKADSLSTCDAIGVIKYKNGDTYTVVDCGYVDFSSSSIYPLTDGGTYFVSDTVAGELTTTEPTIIGYISKPLMAATSTSGGFIINHRGMQNKNTSGYSGFSGYSGISPSSLHVIAQKSADYTADYWEVVKVNSSGEDITITLPTAVGNLNKEIVVKKMHLSNNVIVDANGAETIDESASYTLTALYQSVTVISDNSNWIVI